VYADVVEGQGNSTEIVANAQKWFEQKILPEQPGLHFEIQGAGLEQQKALQSLSVAFPIALLIIYMMLAGLFRSYLQPLVVMIAIPFGVQGAFLGHWITGHDITIMSIIGLVALNGIVVNDSLVLLDFINALERQGLRPYDACAAASKLRLRAILLTTLTTVSGLTPLMFEQSFQAKFLIPLVVTLSFGLIFATLLTLCLVPALNLVLVDLTRRRSVS